MMDDQTNKILKELVVARRFFYLQLMDLAKEQGRPFLARAWEWMLANNRYPSEKVSERLGMKYGWTFPTRVPCPEDAAKHGETILPHVLLRMKLMKSTPCDTPEEALYAAANALAAYYDGSSAHG